MTVLPRFSKSHQMDFAGPAVRVILRLQFYNEPPSQTLELEKLEQLAVDRLKILKCVESVGQDFVKGSREYEERLSSDLVKLGPLGKSFTLSSNQVKNASEDIERDITSHFILQIAYCRSETLRRWFVHQESDLFRYRFCLERTAAGRSSTIIDQFLATNNLCFSHLSPSEARSIHNQLIAGTAASKINPETTIFYKVHFSEVPDLVRGRRTYLRRGFAYVPDADLVTLVVTRFRSALSRNLSRLCLALLPCLPDEEARLLPLLTSLSRRYLGDDYANKAPLLGSVSATQVEQLARQPGVFPPCMARLHEGLMSNHHLRHWGRMQYGLFLKGIGLSLEESLKFWRNVFAPKIDAEQFSKQYAYSIRHNYGKEGKRTDYTPYSCMKIISQPAPGVGEFHGCPFKHMDPELLHQRLTLGGRLTAEAVDAIVTRARDKQYQLACREYFKAMHPSLSPEDAAAVNITHPNQFFEVGQKVANGTPLSNAAASAIPATSRTKARKVPLNESRLMNTSELDDSSVDAELSKIDSTLLEYSSINF
ncbi:unnamed protein product [Schistocephalus solidus]|uniref:DNA primase large subunit n=1 Tax=Schistocephalus solidus TaxID=70667 RepID=A0A3P7CWS6_SCHSO|nr:unnamed protein product [Schistocephalus solidus]